MIAVATYFQLRRERVAARRLDALKRKFVIRILILAALIAAHFAVL